MAENDQGHPVTLLAHDQNIKSDNFSVNTDACAELKKQFDLQDRELIVISINGEYRKGKSFFLNYIMRYLRNQVNLLLMNFLTTNKTTLVNIEIQNNF